MRHDTSEIKQQRFVRGPRSDLYKLLEIYSCVCHNHHVKQAVLSFKRKAVAHTTKFIGSTGEFLYGDKGYRTVIDEVKKLATD